MVTRKKLELLVESSKPSVSDGRETIQKSWRLASSVNEEPKVIGTILPHTLGCVLTRRLGMRTCCVNTQLRLDSAVARLKFGRPLLNVVEEQLVGELRSRHFVTSTGPHAKRLGSGDCVLRGHGTTV
jgi:hypothetical protein